MYTNNGQLDSKFVHQLREYRGWFMVLGILLIALGSLAIMFAYTSTLFSVVYLGALLVVLGIFELVHAFSFHPWTRFLLHLLLGLLYVASGAYILWNPALNALTLTLLLAIFFVISGIARFMFAMLHPQIPHHGWLAFNGIVTFVLGILIWYQWPVSGLWVIGTLVGIDAIFTGWAWIMLAVAAKRLKAHNA